AHHVDQDQRVEHGIEGVEHPAESGGEQGAALLGSCLLQELDGADRHAGSDCISGAVCLMPPMRGGASYPSRRRYFCAFRTSRPICSFSASTDGNLISSRRRSRKCSSTSVSAESSIG